MKDYNFAAARDGLIFFGKGTYDYARQAIHQIKLPEQDRFDRLELSQCKGSGDHGRRFRSGNADEAAVQALHSCGPVLCWSNMAANPAGE